MTRTENERLAVVENDVRHLTLRHEEFRDEVREEFKSVRGDVAEIKAILTKAEGGWLAMVGGWRALVVVGGVIAGCISMAQMVWGWVVHFLPVLPR